MARGEHATFELRLLGPDEAPDVPLSDGAEDALDELDAAGIELRR